MKRNCNLRNIVKPLILMVFVFLNFNASCQQLTSNVNNANGDLPNILIANPSAAGITNDNRATIWLDNDGKFKFRNVTGKGYAFRDYANTDDQVVIDIHGNIGIGSTAPLGRLQVNSPLDGAIAAVTIGSASPGNIATPLGKTVGGYNIDFETWRDIVPIQTGARIRAERINNHADNNALVQAMDLVFYTSTGIDQTSLTEKLRIRNDGDIGIGTPNPQAKLGVNGLIRCKEVKVEMSNWPDYVFKDGFKLPTLAELNKYIDRNHHLPGLPSAETLKNDGLNLGEINRLVAQKVEELTLYLIEKDKQEKKHAVELTCQKSQIDALIKANQFLLDRVKLLESYFNQLSIK